MKKKLKISCVVWLLLCLPSVFGLRGCGTSMLYDKNIRHLSYGPSPVEFTRGYSNGKDIFLEYHAVSDDFHDYTKKMIWHAVGTIGGGQEINTAAVSGKNKNSPNQFMEIHWDIFKSPLGNVRAKEMKEILVEKIYQEADKDKKREQQDRINKAIENKTPILLHGHSRHLTLIMNSISDKNTMLNYDLSTQHIAEIVRSPQKHVELILCWPFAVIIDYITLPILLILPDPFIDG